MEVKFLDNKEFEEWNKFVDLSPQGFIFSKSYWLEVVCNSDFKICVLKNENEIFAGMVLPFYSSKKIRMPIITQTLGILFKEMNEMKKQKQLTNQKEYTNLLMEFILKNKKIERIDLNYSYKYNYWLPLFWKKFKQTTRYTYLINYKEIDLKEEFTKFSKGHKWTLKKIEKNKNLLIEETNDITDIYNVLMKTYERQKKKIGYNKKILGEIFEKLIKRQEIKAFRICNKENKITQAVVIYIYNKKEVYYWLGGSDPDYRDEGVHTYLIWYGISYFSDKVDIFNFGGSMLENVEKNFKNFGGTPTQYYNIFWYKNWLKYYLKQIIKGSYCVLN